MDKIRIMNRELISELEKKVDQKNFDRKYEGLKSGFEDQLGIIQKNSEMVREVCDRVRMEVRTNGQLLNDLKNDLEKKLSHEEGRLLWANFQKYAVYDDLRDLYSKCLPAISSFEDKLIEYYNEQDKVNIMLRRFDEVICEKATRTEHRELQNLVELEFLTKKEHENFKAEQG